MVLFASLSVAMPFFSQAAGAATTAAPADEYFGRMHMSIIGIRNELKILDQRISDDPVHAERHIPTCELVEDSLEHWAAKYPTDTWLQGELEHLESVYAHVSSLEGRLHLARLVLWVHDHLSGSPVDDDARLTAAKFFDVPLHSDDPQAAMSPDPLDPTAPTPGPSATTVASPNPTTTPQP